MPDSACSEITRSHPLGPLDEDDWSSNKTHALDNQTALPPPAPKDKDDIDPRHKKRYPAPRSP